MGKKTKEFEHLLKKYKSKKGSPEEKIAYIIILDNIVEDGKEFDAGEGQTVRPKEKFEHLFKLA